MLGDRGATDIVNSFPYKSKLLKEIIKSIRERKMHRNKLVNRNIIREKFYKNEECLVFSREGRRLPAFYRR